jgi:hypothetical protein
MTGILLSRAEGEAPNYDPGVTGPISEAAVGASVSETAGGGGCAKADEADAESLSG